MNADVEPWPARALEPIVAGLGSAPARAGATRVVAIDGPSGAGKSTLAAALSERLAGAPVVHLDDLYPGWDGLAEIVPRLLEWVLLPLAAGRPARYRRFDWVRAEYAEWHDVPAAGVLIVEGVGAASRACRPHLSLTVWVEAEEPLRMERGIARDGEAYRPNWERWAVQERALFAAEGTRARADVILDTTAARARSTS